MYRVDFCYSVIKPLWLFCSLQIRDVLGKLSPKELSVEVPINVKLWQVEGVHEFLASLGRLAQSGIVIL